MKKIHSLILALLLAGCSLIQKPAFTAQSISHSGQGITQTATLSRCVDGDTAHFIVDEETQKVRFLSIDTPEVNHENESASEPFAVLASDYTCQALQDANVIQIQTDPFEDPVDQYGRILAWIWVDETLLNAKLVELGYAEVAFVKTINLYSLDLEKLEALAQKARRGIWSD